MTGVVILPLAAGLLSHVIRQNDRHAADGLLVLAGFGIGITLGPLSLQAQYSHPPKFAAVLVTLNLFVSTPGSPMMKYQF